MAGREGDIAGSEPRTVGDDAAKQPRTARGQATRRKLLDAAVAEFGERGFHESSVSSITRAAGVALGSFYTYFDSKDAIFRAVVADMSAQVKAGAKDAVEHAPRDALAIERGVLEGFLAFAREHKEIYRIIDEAEFVDPDSYRRHYENAAARILDRLRAGAQGGALRGDLGEEHAWAVMGMNVFLGLRYAVWDEGADLAQVAERANAILREGLAASAENGGRGKD